MNKLIIMGREEKGIGLVWFGLGMVLEQGMHCRRTRPLG